jgi:hypothetical protein
VTEVHPFFEKKREGFMAVTHPTLGVRRQHAAAQIGLTVRFW